MKKLIGLFFGLLMVFGIAAGASAITIDLNTGTAFQNEGTTSADHTALLKNLDGSWGSAIIGTVGFDYYATGSGVAWFDAISLNFDLSGIGYSNVSDLELRFYLQKGDYEQLTEQVWENYQVLQGAFNSTNEDFGALYAPGNIDFYPAGTAGDSQTIGWISSTIDLSWVTSNDFDVTLRLWNARIDRVELVANTATVPEPSTILLLGSGLLGLVGTTRRKMKK